MLKVEAAKAEAAAAAEALSLDAALVAEEAARGPRRRTRRCGSPRAG